MNAIQDTALLESLSGGLKPAREPASKELGQAEFFELMIAQLKNQDPAKPLDGQDYLGQLAQFSTVNGIQGLQQSFNQLSQSLQSLHALQASSLVGRSVMVDGDRGYLSDAQPLQGSVNVTDNVNDLTLVVSDRSGRELRRLNLGQQAAGQVAFSWDGKDSSGAQAGPGLYRIRAEAPVDGTMQGLETRVRAAVQSVSLDSGAGGGGMTLNLAGLGERDVSSVREIL